MLSDSHFKVLHYESDASVMFTNTEIKGGVVISYRDNNKTMVLSRCLRLMENLIAL